MRRKMSVKQRLEDWRALMQLLNEETNVVCTVFVNERTGRELGRFVNSKLADLYHEVDFK